MSDSVNMAPVSCPNCDCFGIPLSEGRQGKCMQCGWEGDTGWEPPKNFPRYIYVAGRATGKGTARRSHDTSD